MGETWEMIAHERRETLGKWGTCKDFMNFEFPLLLIHRLAVPVDGAYDDSDLASGPVPYQQSAQHHSHLLQLPIEIFLLITDQLDLDSLYTLTHCCWLLRKLLRKEVRTRFRLTLAPWANTPLVCAGSNMISNPPRIKTKITKHFQPEVKSGKPALNIYDVMMRSHPINVLSVSHRLYLPTCFPTTPPSAWSMHQFGRHLRPWECIMKLPKYFPPGRHWVLRNLTIKEYVYGHMLPTLGGKGSTDSPDTARFWDYSSDTLLGYTLGTLVVVNTCWSNGNRQPELTGLQKRGRWAGHSFDIVEEARLLLDIEGGNGTWVDVTLREHEAMMRLFDGIDL